MKIKDIGKTITGKTPSTKILDFFGGNIPFVTPEDLTQGFILNNFKRFISENGYKSIKNNTLDGISVLVGCIGSDMGNVAITTGKCATNQQINAITNFSNDVNPFYVYYYLSNQKKYLRLIAGMTTTPILPKSNFDEIDIPIFEKNIQDKIVGILIPIDRKIKNNLYINEVLKSYLNTLYEYWFLQYDFPNEEGKPYKSSGGKMVWNDELKREIPESWEVRKVKDCLVHINTGLNPRDHFVLNDGEIKYITVKNLTTMGELNFAGCDMISEKTKKIINRRSMISKGDILFASIAPLGRCYMIREDPKEWEINESVFSIRHNDKLSSEYLYQYFMSDYFIKKAEHSSTGSVFAGIRITTLQEMDIVVPTKKVLEHFTKKVSNLYDLKHKISIENQKLAALRDFLLPLLMNGQVTFKGKSYEQ